MVVTDVAADTAAGGRTEHAPSPVTVDDMPATRMGFEGAQPESGSFPGQPDQQTPERLAVDRGDGGQDGDQPVDGKPESQPDAAAVLQPHTACFDTGNNRQLYDLTVDEVIEAVQDADLRDKLRTVCLTDDRCYMTFANAECLERALHSAVFRVRDVPVLLMDTGAGAVILSLTGVPDTVTDKDVLKCLKKYGTIIGGVDRKTGRGRTTAGGERYVRVRPTVGAPRYLWFGSDKVTVRQLTEHETGTMNSIARRKSFRSQIKLNLKMADPSPQPLPQQQQQQQQQPSAAAAAAALVGVGSSESSPASTTTGTCVESGYGNGVVGNGVRSAAATAATTAVSVQNGFRFPSDAPAKTATGTSAPVTEPKTAPPVAPASPNKPTTASGSLRKSGKPAAPNDNCPPQTVGAAESPLRGRRRASLMGFRRETVIKHRGGSVSRTDGEDADSDTSTICRRKLSITGHENTEKVPWCGCWGNGCL